MSLLVRLASSGDDSGTGRTMLVPGLTQIRLTFRTMNRVYNGGRVVLVRELGRRGYRAGEASIVR